MAIPFGKYLQQLCYLHCRKNGLKAQKVNSPEQRSGYKLTIYLALWKSKRKDKAMPHYLLLRLQRANKLITFYPGRMPWAIILLGLRPATARNIGCCTIAMVTSFLRLRPASAHNHIYYTTRRTIVLLGLHPAISRTCGWFTMTFNPLPFIVKNWHTTMTGWKPKR